MRAALSSVVCDDERRRVFGLYFCPLPFASCLLPSARAAFAFCHGSDIETNEVVGDNVRSRAGEALPTASFVSMRSEEHTSELQSLRHLVCRLLLEKKKI